MAIEHDYITAELSNRQMMKALELFPIYKVVDGEMAIVALDGSGRLCCDFVYDRIFCYPGVYRRFRIALFAS